MAVSEATLKNSGVKYCFFNYVNIHGQCMGKIIPIDILSRTIACGGAFFAGVPDDGIGQRPNELELGATGDIKDAVVLPWNREIAWLPCSLWRDGKRHLECSRNILIRACESAERVLKNFNVGFEAELYLLSGKSDYRKLLSFTKNEPSIPAYNLSGTIETYEFWSRIDEYCRALGWGALSITHEGGKGQLEFSLGYASPLVVADRFLLFKTLVKDAARQVGAIATFMPKPYSDDLGSSLHMNFSMEAVSAFQGGQLDKQYGLGLPEQHYNYIAGLLLHAKAAAAIVCPTVNSYKRFIPQNFGVTWAPKAISYGLNNRTSLVRVVPRDGRIEFRLPDASCNIYLALAIGIACGIDGIISQADPGPPDGNDLGGYYAGPKIGAEVRSYDALPESLLEALHYFRTNDVMTAALGELLKSDYVRIKTNECVEFSRHVTGWEVKKYLFI